MAGVNRRFTGNIAEFSTELVQTVFAQCDHSFRIRCGFQRTARNSKQRWRCRFCGKWMTEGVKDNRLARINKLAPLFKLGSSISATSRATGYSRKVVAKFYRLFEAYVAEVA